MNDTPHPITAPQPEPAPAPDWQAVGPRLAAACRAYIQDMEDRCRILGWASLAEYEAAGEVHHGHSLIQEALALLPPA